MRTSIRRSALAGLLALALLALATGSAMATGSGVGWAITARTLPTNLELPTNAQQEIRVNATGGKFILFHETAPFDETASIPVGSPASLVQSELEAMPTIGVGNVEVTGGPLSYLVTYIGRLATTPVPELEAFPEELTGGAEEVSVAVKTVGATSGTIDLQLFNIGAVESEGTITVTDRLPPGIHAQDAGEIFSLGASGINYGIGAVLTHERWICSGNGPGPAPNVKGASIVTCRNNPLLLKGLPGGGGLPNVNDNRVPEIGISVDAEGEESGLVNRASAAGGGAASAASTANPVTVSSAPASFAVSGWQAWFSNADGSRATRAGSHPYEATFSFDLPTAVGAPDSSGNREGFLPGGEVRNLEVQLPAGLVGNPTAVPQCSRLKLLEDACPQASQVGTTQTKFIVGFNTVRRVFNMEAPPGAPAEFAFNLEGILVFLDSNARTGSDSGITTKVRNLPQRVLTESILTLWGVPGDASHNPWRFDRSEGCNQEEIEHAGPIGGKDNPCAAPQLPLKKPLFTLPTSCGPVNPFTITALDTWQDPSLHSSATTLYSDPNGNPQPIIGCESLAYEPAISLEPETSDADSPTGLSAEVTPPLGGLEEAEATAPSNTKHVTVTLPKGITVNAGQAAGLQACQETAAQSAIGTEDSPNCPAASKVGTAVIKTPLLESAQEKTLQGNVYILQSNPPQLHLLVAASADGVNLKLVGIAHLDPSTGQLVTTFGSDPQVEAEDPFLAGHLALPDLPFSSFRLSFNGGSHAALVTPAHCGTYTAAADMTPWASPSLPDLNRSPSFNVTAGPAGSSCPSTPLPFTPSLVAGTTNPVAGSSSSFALKLTRPDAEQNIEAIQMTLPPGQLAKLAGVPLCPAASTASGNCPSASQVGSVSAAVGPGPNPLAVPQPGKSPTAVYLSGPYKGAPYSLVVDVPAQAGPFDLGTVVTRVALQVNETTTQVTAVSDPLPQILDGVPLDYQQIVVSVDRKGFIQNPTNCEPMKVTGTISGSEGAKAAVFNRYQIGSCASLGFKPSLKLSLKGPTKRTGLPRLKAVLTYPQKGAYANIARAQVTLPHSAFLEQGHIKTVCKQADLRAGTCPAKSIYGHAKAWSPLLDKPLEGPVYLGVGYGHKLPDLVADLGGQIRVLLNGKVDTGREDGLRNTFLAVPDAPVSRFELNLFGGKRGLVVNSENLCGPNAKVKAIADFTAQNGKTYDAEPMVANDCGKKAKRNKKKASKRVGTSHR